jgi:hypothetical protein
LLREVILCFSKNGEKILSTNALNVVRARRDGIGGSKAGIFDLYHTDWKYREVKTF